MTSPLRIRTPLRPTGRPVGRRLGLAVALAVAAAQLVLGTPAGRPAAASTAPPAAPAPASPAPDATPAADASPAPAAPPSDSALQIEGLKAQLAANPYDAKLHTRLGILYAQENLLEEARGEFIAAIQAAPLEPTAHLNLGICLIRMERHDEAVAPLEAYIKLAPSSAQGYELLGQAQAKRGDVASARATWQTGLANPSLGPAERAKLIQRIAQTYIDAQQWDKAIQLLEEERELARSSDGGPLRESLAFIYLSKAQAARDAGDEERALGLFAKAREAGTTNPVAYLIPADALLAAGKLDEAEALLKKAEPTLGNDATMALLKARIADRRGDLQAAIYNYRLALRRNPELMGVYPKLGELLALQGDATGATEALARANERGEGGPAVSYNLGVILTKQDRYNEALPHLQAAIAGDSTMQDAYRALGAAYRKLERNPEAIELYQLLATKFGAQPRDLAPLAVLQSRAEQHKQAVETYKLLIQAEPENHAALYNLGLSLAQLSRFEEAAKAFSAALALDPKNEAYQFNLASAYQKLERYEEAIAAYEKALELEVTYRSYVNLAICYDKIGFQESRDKYYKLASDLKNKKKG